mgnify:CR=1 FL=1
MSLKSALLATIKLKQELEKEKEITNKIKKMIDGQKALLDTSLSTNESHDIVRVQKAWNPDIICDGGVSYYKHNNKWYRISVCNDGNDVILKFRFKDARNRLVSISSRTLREAQEVVDDVYGKGKYTVSVCYV